MHLQKNGFRGQAACGRQSSTLTWNLAEVTCNHCRRSAQYKDALLYRDIGSPGREVRPLGNKPSQPSVETT